MKELINVIVPVFNVEEYLQRCIESILEQTYSKFRLILVDDGSPDRCPEICEAYAQKDERVIVIHKENGGLSSARNSALDWLANGSLSPAGEYVAFIDSDDYVTPDYLEGLYKLLHHSQADIAQCGHYIVFSENRRVDKNTDHQTYVLNQKQAIESLCCNGIWDVTAWNKLYKLSIFDKLRFPDGKLYEDTAISHLVASRARLVAVNMTPRYYYTQRYCSTANSVEWKEYKYQLIEAGDAMAEWVIKHYPDLQQVAMTKRVYVRLSTLSQMVNTNHYDAERISQMRSFILKNRKSVLKNKAAAWRDKCGIIVIFFGWNVYKSLWQSYYRFVRRR